MAVDPVEVAYCHCWEVHLRLVSKVSVGDHRILEVVKHYLRDAIYSPVGKQGEDEEPDYGAHLGFSFGRIIDS